MKFTQSIQRALPRSSAQCWSLALALTGFGLLCTMEYAAATYALATSATQGDAILKVAFSLAFGIAAFGGGIVFQHIGKYIFTHGRLLPIC